MVEKKSITERIRDYYVSDNGEWLFEKGKVKEARLLKEICEKHERLVKDFAELKQKEWDAWKKQTEYDHKLQAPLRKRLDDLRAEHNLLTSQIAEIKTALKRTHV